MKYQNILLIIFISFISIQPAAWAENIKVSIKVNYGRDNVEPFDGKIYIRSQSAEFRVVVENTSSSRERLFEDQSDLESAVSLEILNAVGDKTIIKRKKLTSHSDAVTFRYLFPGEEKVTKISVSEEEWRKARVIQDRGSSEFQIRAVFKNETETLYSPYYQVIMRGKPL